MIKYIPWLIVLAAMIVSLNGCAGHSLGHDGDGGDIIDRTWPMSPPPPYGGGF